METDFAILMSESGWNAPTLYNPLNEKIEDDLVSMDEAGMLSQFIALAINSIITVERGQSQKPWSLIVRQIPNPNNLLSVSPL